MRRLMFDVYATYDVVTPESAAQGDTARAGQYHDTGGTTISTTAGTTIDATIKGDD